MNHAPPSLPPPPAVGSPRYFALLYSPAALRATLTTLLALADEISAGAARGLDHSVAHVRLDWWRGEAERYVRGEPQHPWLRALAAQHAGGRGLKLQPLVEAAAVDLATETLSAEERRTLRFELETFVCDGQYEKGLAHILETYLKNIDQAQQPAVWVSSAVPKSVSHLTAWSSAIVCEPSGPRTAKPWFWLVISTLPVIRSLTGWLAPW